MANIANVSHAIPLVKQSYMNLLSLGEGATSDDFRMVIDAYPDLEFLVQATQIPPLAREPIEGFGPHGVQFTQMGRYKNIAEVPITFKEVLTGVVYAAVRDWVRNKRYLKVMLALIGESSGYTAAAGSAAGTGVSEAENTNPKSTVNNTFVLLDTWLELEGVDLSVEDATLIKPAGTLHANWIDHLTPDAADFLQWVDAPAAV